MLLAFSAEGADISDAVRLAHHAAVYLQDAHGAALFPTEPVATVQWVHPPSWSSLFGPDRPEAIY